MPVAEKNTRTTPPSPGVAHLYDRYVAGDPKQRAAYESHLDNAAIARQICELRTRAGLTQRALAKLVGTTASAICRIEDANYQGHSLSMLRRVAAALDARVEVRIVRARNARPAGGSLSRAR
ncbi:MAG: transcriptional regulator [Phycisphaerales bacterium]|nr:MAG: transcriptional regulator [Phycisphaerales bacterium]